jgi:hypothetical protein
LRAQSVIVVESLVTLDSSGFWEARPASSAKSTFLLISL